MAGQIPWMLTTKAGDVRHPLPPAVRKEKAWGKKGPCTAIGRGAFRGRKGGPKALSGRYASRGMQTRPLATVKPCPGPVTGTMSPYLSRGVAVLSWFQR